MNEEDHWTRDLASRLEALLEIGGTALVAGGLFLAVQGLPLMNKSLVGLPPGFGARDTGAFLCAVLVGIVLMPIFLRRLLGGWPPGQILGRRRVSAGKAVGAGLVVASALTLWSQFLLWLAPEILLPVWRSLGVTHVLTHDELPSRAVRLFRERPYWWDRLVPLGTWGRKRLYRLLDLTPPPPVQRGASRENELPLPPGGRVRPRGGLA